MIFAQRPFAYANLLACLIVACLSMSFSTAFALADTDEAIETNAPEQPVFDRVVETGELIHDGKVIDAPYEIEAWSDHWTINGEPLEIELESNNDRRFGGGRNRGWRRPGSSGRGSDSGQRSNYRSTSESARTARRIAEWLDADQVIVSFSGSPAVILNTSHKLEFFTPILAKTPTDQEIEEFEALCNNESLSAVWRSNLDTIQLTPAQHTRWQQGVDDVLAADSRAKSEIAAVRRYDNFSYIFTVAAMLLGTIALGHMLNWSGKGFGDSSPDAMKACTIAVLLMAGLSIVDLLWTITAAQAGQMTEINPLASNFIDSPLALTTLKATSIIISGGIFFWLRQKLIVQKAAWWMCLVLVLVTFRWAVFGAAML